MSLTTIFLFFVYLWGFGFTISSFLKESEDFFERNVMRIGSGLSFFLIFSIVLNMLRIPLNWKIFFVLSIIYPIYYFFKNVKRFKIPEFKFKKSYIYFLITLILFAWTLNMYVTGSFNYFYLEDTDPWSHAKGIKEISIREDAYDPFPFDRKVALTYADPYPPAYDILFAILHQTSPSLNWTMKFFNSLLISLSILFFYFFAFRLTGNRKKTLFSTFVLTMIPSYLSHFIWAHTLIPMLFILVIYAYLMADYDKKWNLVALVGIASIFVVQPSQPIKISLLLLIYLFVDSIIKYKFLWEKYAAFIFGFVLSLSWWLVAILRHGSKFMGGFITTEASSGEATKASVNVIIKIINSVFSLLNPYAGTATRKYTFSDFFIAKNTNMINNPIGLGLVISIVLIFSIFVLFIKYKKILEEQNKWLIVTSFWFIATFLLVNSDTFDLPIGLGAFRVWMLMAIPVSLLCGEGYSYLENKTEKYSILKIIVLLILVGGIYYTSGVQKYAVNTAMWPNDIGWRSQDEISAYAWLKDNIETNANVFDFSARDKGVIGLDKNICFWCEDVINFRKDFFSHSGDELYSFLIRNKFEYVIISPVSIKYMSQRFGENATLEGLQKYFNYMQQNNKFTMAHNTKDSFIFKVN